MASTSEKTYGQRYTKAAGLLEYINTLPTYAPSNDDISAANYQVFLKTVDQANTGAAQKADALSNVRSARLNLYYGPDGLVNRCSRIRDYTASNAPNGRKDKDYVKMKQLVAKLRGPKKQKKEPPPADPATATQKKEISASERSFGSLLQVGKTMAEVMKNITGFAPSNPALTVKNFETFLKSIDTANALVASQYERYDDAVENRGNIYATLKTRTGQIQDTIAAEYSKSSQQYRDSLRYSY